MHLFRMHISGIRWVEQKNKQQEKSKKKIYAQAKSVCVCVCGGTDLNYDVI